MAKQTKYSGTVVVFINKLTTFGENRDSIECMEILKTGAARVNNLDLEHINFSTPCVPVRLTLDPKDTSQDWTKYGSPIEEIGFGNIIRYFPMSAFKFDKSNKKEKITISYPDFIIDLQVVYKSQPADNIVYTEPKEESKEDMEMVETKEIPAETAETAEVTTAVNVNQQKKLSKWTIGAVIGAAVVTTAAIITGVILKNKNNKDKDCDCECECTESETVESVE